MGVQKQALQGQKKKRLQWHPAFYAGIQIELAADADNLIFENEHQLGTKPMGIDVLVIKKQSDKPVHKNIGRIFRRYNIIEYKGPGDYLSVDDWYKVCGYCFFYKADAGKVDSVKISELTISLVSESYPRKLVKHLTKERGYEVVLRENGIYEVAGAEVPTQIIVTRKLSRKENLWLHSLTDRLAGVEDARELVEEYHINKENRLYESVMDIIMEANKKKFEEEKSMCRVMYEIVKENMKEEFEAVKNEAEKLGEEKGMKLGEEKGMKLGEAEGVKKGIKSGVNRVNTLNSKLKALGRLEDILKSISDSEYQNKLFQEFNL